MNNIIYKVVSEWAAPTFYDIDTNEELYDECDASVQALWVVSYDENEHEIVEWLERFYPNEEEEAKARAKELNKEGEQQWNIKLSNSYRLRTMSATC